MAWVWWAVLTVVCVIGAASAPTAGPLLLVLTVSAVMAYILWSDW